MVRALTPEQVRFLREWRAARERTGRRIRPLLKELCAEWGVGRNVINAAASGKTYRWVRP